MKKAGLFFVGLAVVCTLSVEAQSGGGRKRPARPNPTAPTRTCMETPTFPTGKKAHYAEPNNSNFKVWFLYVSDNGSQMAVKSHVEGVEQGYPMVADTDTVTQYVVTNGLLDVKRILADSVSTVTVPIFGGVTSNLHIDINLVPGLISGPRTNWCTDTTWQVPAYTGSMTVSGSVSRSESFQGGGGTGRVIAVNEMVTVPAGTFATVKIDGFEVGASNKVTRVEKWFRNDGIMVKQIAYEDNKTTTWVLTKVE